MKRKRLAVDPMTRIEGHLRFETRVEQGEVVDAHCAGEMFRGIEAGGVTTVPTVDAVMRYQTLLAKVEPFIKHSFFHDVAAVAKAFKGYFKEGKGYGNLLSYSYFPD